MNIDFELYRVFYVVANNGNITKAAMVLNISQPAVSKSIKSLEEQLGGQLFTRTKRGVILTSEGLEFYNYIKQAMEFISSAENKFSDLINLDAGCIRIGIGTTLVKQFLLPYLSVFHSLYPKVDIQIMTNLTSDLIPKLRNGLVDIVIFNLNDVDYGTDIDVVKCREIHDCFVVSDKYIDLIGKEVSLCELNNYPLILQARESNTRHFLDDFAFRNGVVFKPNIELASYSLVVEFTKMGLGIGYATRDYIKSELDNKELYELNVRENIPGRYIAIALSKNHLPNFSTKRLIEIITDGDV